MRLQNKVAIITGSSKGMGRETAIRFAQEGAKVVINHRDSEQEAQDVAAQINDMKGECIIIKADVSDSSDVKRLFTETIKRYGRVDVLVNNAGIAKRAPFLETTLEDWNEVIKVNLTSVFLCCQEAARIMLQQKNGKIVSLSSIRGLPQYGNPKALAYCTSKAGILNITAALAKELAPYVNINAVIPGFIETEMAQGWSEETRREAVEGAALKRLIKPEEVVNTILFLASDEASGITGTHIVIDGGFQIK